jgi:hypothetical protein
MRKPSKLESKANFVFLFVGDMGIVQMIFYVIKKFLIVSFGVNKLVWLVRGGMFAGEAIGAIVAFEMQQRPTRREIDIGRQKRNSLVPGNANYSLVRGDFLRLSIG